ncbi:MAG TPA: IclR family transcriptional regulator [Solirubrobacteraceae bacterium]
MGVAQATRERPAYPISSVGNVLRVLELLGEQEPLTLTRVSRSLGVAPSTAHRLLAMLRYHDFVRQDPRTKAYRPGRGLLSIALAATGGIDARALARPELEALSRRLEETVHLVVLDGAAALFLDSVESRRAVRVTSRVGAAMPAHCTASGKALLLQLPDEGLRALLGADPLAGMTGRSLTTLAALRRELRAARRAGYATNFGESEEGLAAVAVPIPGGAGGSELSITVSTPSDRLDRQRAPAIAAAASEAAQRIARRLASAADDSGPDSGR